MSELRIESSSARTVRIGTGEFVYFGGCDYLGLAHHASVRDALIETTSRFGVSSGASRATSGTTSEHLELERELAQFVGAEAALVTSDGWTADLAATETLARRRRSARIDARGHASLFDAARAASLEIESYANVDAASCDATAESLVMTDGVFPSAGVVAPIGELATRTRKIGAALLVDDAHGLGVLGPNGRGTLAAFGLVPDGDRVLTGTLSKSFGVAGGFVAASREFVESTRAARAYVGTTPIPPALAAAARAALAIAARGEATAKLAERIAQFRRGMASNAFVRDVDARLPVFAIELETPERTRELHEALLARGLFVPLVRYLATRPNEYLRLALRASHEPDDVERLNDALTHFRIEHVALR